MCSQVFQKVLLNPDWDFHDRIMNVVNSAPPESQKIAVIQVMSQDSLNLLKISCTADDGLFKVLVILRRRTLF